MAFNNKKPIFETIKEDYKHYIEIGVYHKGDRLPSVRMLANDLGVNPNTVQKAYSLLEEEGYIETLEKKGVYVKYNQEDEVDLKIVEAKRLVNEIKKSGVTYSELLEIIEGEYNDSNKELR